MTRENGQADPRVLLVGAAGAAGLVGCSPRSWQRLAAAELVPEPLALGGKRLWSVFWLEKWAIAGCPNRQEFESLRRAIIASWNASETTDRRPRTSDRRPRGRQWYIGGRSP